MAAAGRARATPVLLFLRARVFTRVSAPISSPGNHALLHELSPAGSGMCTIRLQSSKCDRTQDWSRTAFRGGLEGFSQARTASARDNAKKKKIKTKKNPTMIPLTPVGSGFRVLLPGFAKPYLN